MALHEIVQIFYRLLGLTFKQIPMIPANPGNQVQSQLEYFSHQNQQEAALIKARYEQLEQAHSSKMAMLH